VTTADAQRKDLRRALVTDLRRLGTILPRNTDDIAAR
jgi:hypothetical protein